jgi:NAD(P)-dependent dehydrogenase (short-subunit alcohol dehydrogenase family)
VAAIVDMEHSRGSRVREYLNRPLVRPEAEQPGGTSGIGREAAVLFAEAGSKVVIAGRREKEGNETLELVRKAGGQTIFVVTDVSKVADVQTLVKKTVGRFGRVDTAFNNAGIEGNWMPMTDLPEDEWERVIDINLKGVFLCLKYQIQQMLKQGAGVKIESPRTPWRNVWARSRGTFRAADLG